MIIEIENIRYFMSMGCGIDSWRIVGNAIDHPVYGYSEVQPSTPVSFNREEKTFKTYSGKTYKIVSFSMNEEDFWKALELSVVEKGYETRRNY